MAGKRIIAGLDGTGGPEALLAQAHRLVFEGADELCLLSGAGEIALRSLVTHLDQPITVCLSDANPAQIEAMLRLGACRVWIEDPGEAGGAGLLAAGAPFRLGIRLGEASAPMEGRLEALMERGLCELIAPLSLLREHPVVGLAPVPVVAEGRGEPLEGVEDWLLSGGDGWLREPGSAVSIPALKQALVRAGVRVRT